MIDLRDIDVKFPLAISRRSSVNLLPNWEKLTVFININLGFLESTQEFNI
jgi:hypothetical protein